VAVAAGARTPATWSSTFALGVLTGLVYFAGTLYWVVNVMGQYGGLSTPVAALIGLLLWAYLALYPGLFALLLRRAIEQYSVRGVWLAPLFWVATEWLRGWVGGGFPWALLGSSQASVLPVAQWSAVTGVFGLSALVALVSTAAAMVALTRPPVYRKGLALVAVLLVAITSWGMWRIREGSLVEGPTIRLGLVQGSVDQDQKWDPRFRDEIIARYLSLSREVIGQRADLVLWPEASTPFYFDAEEALAQPIRRLAREANVPFIIGTDEFMDGADGVADEIFNAAVLVDGQGRTRMSYRKMKLVPFGEYVPLKSILFFVGPLVEAVSDFSAGTQPTVLDADSRRVSVAICYESEYPAVSRAFVR
jgi:apolipoprotein N-acyltransferase